jgi:hypothetical protein
MSLPKDPWITRVTARMGREVTLAILPRTAGERSGAALPHRSAGYRAESRRYRDTRGFVLLPGHMQSKRGNRTPPHPTSNRPESSYLSLVPGGA